jgi:hypothetical protein
LRYNRSSFFTFLFFIQKLSGKTMDKFYKSCRVFTRSPTKLSLHFSEFSTIFYRFHKFQVKGFSIEEAVFATNPLERSEALEKCPRFATSERSEVLQWGPRWRPAVVTMKFRRGRRPWPGGSGRRVVRWSPRLGLRVRSGRRFYR